MVSPEFNPDVDFNSKEYTLTPSKAPSEVVEKLLTKATEEPSEARIKALAHYVNDNGITLSNFKGTAERNQIINKVIHEINQIKISKEVAEPVIYQESNPSSKTAEKPQLSSSQIEEQFDDMPATRSRAEAVFSKTVEANDQATPQKAVQPASNQSNSASSTAERSPAPSPVAKKVAFANEEYWKSRGHEDVPAKYLFSGIQTEQQAIDRLKQAEGPDNCILWKDQKKQLKVTSKFGTKDFDQKEVLSDKDSLMIFITDNEKTHMAQRFHAIKDDKSEVLSSSAQASAPRKPFDVVMEKYLVGDIESDEAIAFAQKLKNKPFMWRDSTDKALYISYLKDGVYNVYPVTDYVISQLLNSCLQGLRQSIEVHTSESEKFLETIPPPQTKVEFDKKITKASKTPQKATQDSVQNKAVKMHEDAMLSPDKVIDVNDLILTEITTDKEADKLRNKLIEGEGFLWRNKENGKVIISYFKGNVYLTPFNQSQIKKSSKEIYLLEGMSDPYITSLIDKHEIKLGKLFSDLVGSPAGSDCYDKLQDYIINNKIDLKYFDRFKGISIEIDNLIWQINHDVNEKRAQLGKKVSSSVATKKQETVQEPSEKSNVDATKASSKIDGGIKLGEEVSSSVATKKQETVQESNVDATKASSKIDEGDAMLKKYVMELTDEEGESYTKELANEKSGKHNISFAWKSKKSGKYYVSNGGKKYEIGEATIKSINEELPTVFVKNPELMSYMSQTVSRPVTIVVLNSILKGKGLIQ